jgi:subtilase family serine protease
MAADNLLIVYTQVNTNGVVIQTGKVIPVGGTSAAAPLWAAFTSLVKEQAANEGLPSVGFLNPSLYAIGGSSSYSNCFHDITVGNDTNTYSANLFLAYPGYDLCTGWGSPNGLNLINALVGFSGPIFVDFGYTGGGSNGTYYKPFTTLSQGISAVANGGTIIILNGGTSDPTTTITKPMNINAQGGSATIVN